MKLAQNSGTRIIDASSAHRVAEGWAYGFPELIGHAAIANAQFVSNPGVLSHRVSCSARAAGACRDAACRLALHRQRGKRLFGWGQCADRTVRGRIPPSPFAPMAWRWGTSTCPEMRAYAGLTHAPVFSPAVCFPPIAAWWSMCRSPATLLSERNSAPMFESELATHYAASEVVNGPPIARPAWRDPAAAATPCRGTGWNSPCSMAVPIAIRPA